MDHICDVLGGLRDNAGAECRELPQQWHGAGIPAEPTGGRGDLMSGVAILGAVCIWGHGDAGRLTGCILVAEISGRVVAGVVGHTRLDDGGRAAKDGDDRWVGILAGVLGGNDQSQVGGGLSGRVQPVCAA